MSAPQLLPLTVTPLCLVHEYGPAPEVVELDELEPEEPEFGIAKHGRPQDAMLSFAIAPGLIRIELCEPEELVLDVRLDVERRLPPIVLSVRHGAEVEPIRLLGGHRSAGPSAPTWVRRGGSPTDLVVAIAQATPAAFLLDRDYCELSWTVGRRPRSLRFTSVGLHGQLLLRPSRRD